MEARRAGNGRALRLSGFALLLAAGLAGCSFGPRRLPADRFNYSAAIQTSRNQQMLRNIVAARYLQMPEFLTVSSVITAYTYQGGIGVLGQRGMGGFNNNFVGGSANLNYIERPTITYTPLAGEKFSRRMLKTIPIEALFTIGQSGWPPDILLRIAVQRIGQVENVAFAQSQLEGELGVAEAEKLKRYDRVIALMLRLLNSGALELVRVGDETPIFSFDQDLSPELRALAAELKGSLGLELGRNSFKVTDRLTDRASDEVVFQTRSLLAIMFSFAPAVEVPEDDVAAQRVPVFPPEIQQQIQERGPLRIRSQERRPEDAHAAIRYRDQWFFVDGRDHVSKRTFGTLLMLFELLAPSGSGAAPLLTLPTR